MKAYQMTLTDLFGTEFKPVAEHKVERGLINYYCPVCNSVVGIFSTGTVHEWGWMLKAEECSNGHVISWGGRL